MQGMSDHAKGLTLTILGVLILTPDTLLIRLTGLDPWSLLVWRGLFQAIGIFAILLAVYRARTWEICRSIGLSGLLAGAIFALSSLGFLISLAHTSVANTLVIVATAPLFAAIFSFLLMGERIALRTLFAIIATLAGVIIMSSSSWERGSIIGDLAALVTAMTLGLKFTIFRRRKETNMVPSLAASGVMMTFIGLLVAPSAFNSAPEGIALYALIAMGLFVVPIASALITLGPRYISAPEVSLIFLLETALGPLWVWLVLSEQPPERTMIGGAVILSALLTHSCFTFRAQRRKVAELTA